MSEMNPSRALHRHHGSSRVLYGCGGRPGDGWRADGKTNPIRPGTCEGEIDPRTSPDATTRPESDAGRIEAMIRETAARFAPGVATRADRKGRPLPRDEGSGRFVARAGATAERDVIAYLTAEAFSLALAELARQIGVAHRSTALRRRRRGEALVREARLKNEPKW